MANPKDMRDAALLSLLYVFALRVSGIAGLDWSEQRAGTGWLSISGAPAELTLIRSKGSQADPVTVAIPRAENPRAMKAIENWVRFTEIQPGQPLMRGLTRGGNVRTARMHPASLGTVIKARIVLHLMALGAQRDKAKAEAAKYSGHSGRVGFYVAASEAGARPQHITAIARHKTLNMARRYSEKAGMLKNAPHRLLGVGI